ncbi:MAG: hypothetical protein EAZ73_09120 [Oscillatoriales cyanobacterium]|uniref:antA/AntB antirepressor family protein n=1 Tax=unclassified Microcoleus TaxID=2642155 RepID=UPI001DC724BE|nr:MULTISPECIES: antA/AntB antirepressor family protein [unclassified Microcoleus]MCC3459798.1 antA/AntB antirepressor family protein [Microcoleus sp. PH2017_11_PCY_U_A]TAF00863.1 MAG: hypothetical protein EAZ79_01475 [Oscillatoriales cyanobacterium]TAF21378.1 MAG: hypothetical protein EAZ73_09120 [Oscillatoriales cyanobacterium]TAF39695.1 MAG: hypothetical protein EAZ69_00225 [Oscillatoriales cyanobacterium]
MDFSIELAKSLIESTEQFPIDLEQAWVWLGYTRKDSALDTLKSYFEEGVDFSASNRKSPTGGRPSHSYRLSVNCFKELGMLAKTSQGKQIRKYFLECEKIAKSKAAPRPVIGAYIERVKSIYENSSNVPKGYWTVLSEASGLLLWVETVLKLPVDKFDLMDGSIGTQWAKYRADKKWAVDRKQYDYQFPDGRKCKAWSYHRSEMIEFRAWLDDAYKPNLLPVYLEGKYGAMVYVDAVA